MVQSRFAEAAESAREALGVAREVGYREAEAIALNALGTALGESGEVDAGVAYLRESLAIAREEGLEMEESGAWINISDVLNLAGRTEEALGAALEGLETAYTQDWRTTDWLQLSISEFRFHLGDWSGAEEAIPPASRRHTGGTLLYWHTCRAQLALGRGDHDAAEEAIATLATATADLTEPQFVGMHGILSAELSRRRGDIDAARAVIDDALDRIEFCSEDVVRIAALAVLGLRVEGDAGQAAQDRHDKEGTAIARTRADALLERSRAAAEAGLVVESAQLATSEGEHARATGGEAVGHWRTAAERWTSLAAPTSPRTRAGARPRRSWQVVTARARRWRHRRRWPAHAGSAAPGWRKRWSRSPPGRGCSSARARRQPQPPRARRATTPSASPYASATCSRSGRGRHESRDRRAPAHGRKDCERPRLADPGEAERALPDRGGGGCAPARSGIKRLMRTLVTGATGFIGGRLAAALAERGAEVRCLVRDRERAADLAAAGHELHEGDVLDADSLRGAGEGVTTAYYLVHSMGGAPTGRASPNANAAPRRTSRACHRARASRPGVPRPARRRALRAPAQPRRHGGHARAGGAAARVLPRGHGDPGRQRVVPHGPLPGRAAAGDDRAGLVAKPHPADRNRRRARVPGSGRRATGCGRGRGADRRARRTHLLGGARR